MTQTARAPNDLMLEAWAGIGLDDSPLLTDIDPRDYSQWWRTPVGLVVGLAAAFGGLLILMIIAGVVWMVTAGPAQVQAQIPHLQDLMTRSTPQDLATSMGVIVALCVLNGAAAVIVVVLASIVCRKSPWKSFTAVARWRWGQLAVGLILGLATLAPVMAFDVWRGGNVARLPVLHLTHSPAEIVVYVAVSVIGLVLAAGAEEILFRGWLMRQLAGLSRFTWIFLPLTAVLFAAAHGEFDPNAMIDRTLAGVALGYMALRLGGVEYSTGAHAANNLLIVLFVSPISLTPPTPMPFDPWVLGEGIVALALAVAAVEIAVRWPGLRSVMAPLRRNEQTQTAVF